MEELNDFAPFGEFLIFWSNFYRECPLDKSLLLERGIEYNFNSVEGCLLDKRHLIRSGCVLGHLW